MTKLSWFAALLSLFLLIAPAQAQNEAPSNWQDVITGQIQAFRDKDAPAALSFASTPFQTRYTSPEEFFLTIVASGYSPIMDSRSHSFGPFELIEPTVLIQDVKFVGTDQALYEAIYQMIKETTGWRVSGVQLVKTPGVGV